MKILSFILFLNLISLTGCNHSKVNRSISSINDFESNTKTRTFKKYLGKYEKAISGVIEYHDGATNKQLSLRYFSPELGYFYGGNGILTDSQELVDFAHLYLIYLIKKKQGLEIPLSQEFINKAKFDKISPYIKLREGKIKVGDFIFIPKFMNLGIKNKCHADFGDIVWVTHSDDLLVTGTFFPVHYFRGDNYRVTGRCNKGKKVALRRSLVEPNAKGINDNFNIQFINEAMRRSKSHDIIIADYIGKTKYIDIFKNDLIRLCTGMRGGSYHKILAELVGRHFNAEITDIINTNGSVENIANVNQGICDIGLVQRDVFLQKQSKLLLKDVIHYMDLDLKEAMYLVCLKNKNTEKLKSSRDLDGSYSVLVGALNSGALSTWENISSMQSNFVKVRTKNIGGIEAFNMLTQENGTFDCMFNVSNDTSSIISMAKNYEDNIRLIPIELDLGKAEKLGYDEVSFEGINTLSVNTDLIINKDAIETKGIESLKILDLLNKRNHKNITNESITFSQSVPNICTGAKGGGYEGFGIYLKENLSYKIRVINTEGSVYNLNNRSTEYKRGCDITLFQGDLELSKNIVSKTKIMSETAALICNQNTHGNSLETILDGGRVNISVGSLNSGSLVTWNKLISSYYTAKKINQLNYDHKVGVNKLLKGEIDCLFAVGEIHSSFFKKLDNPLSKVRLINILKVPSSYSKSKINKTVFQYTIKSEGIRTFSVPSYLTLSPRFKGTQLEVDLNKVILEYKNVK